MGKILTKDRKSPPNDPTNPSATSTGSRPRLVLSPEMLAHPLFKCSEDPILSTIIESLKCLANSENDNTGIMRQNRLYCDYLQEVPSDGRTETEIIAEFKRIDEANVTICQKLIAPNSFFFRCIDCEKTEDPLTIALQCHQCFSEAQHDGHRIVKVISGGTVFACDCGRVESMKPEGFCPRHKHKEENVEDVLKDFPEVIRFQFTDAVKKTIYGVVCLFEIEQKAGDSKSKWSINTLAATYLEALINFYGLITSKLSRSFSLLLERVLRLGFDEKYSLVWHDCNDMKNEDHTQKSKSGEPNPCCCTLLGCLMRFSKHIYEQIQMNLCTTIVECFKEKKSINSLHRELYKHSYFLFGHPGTPSQPGKRHSSKMCQLFPKTVSLEESELQYIDNLLEILKEIVEDCSTMNNDKCLAMQIINGGITMFLNSKTKASDKALLETDLMNKLLELVSRFQVVAFYPGEIKLGIYEHSVDYTNLSDRIGAESLLYWGLDHGLKRLGDLSELERDPYFRNFAKAWNERFQSTMLVLDHQRLYKKLINPLSGLEKTLCLMIIHYLQEDISRDSIEGFFRKFLPDVYPTMLASNAIKGSLVTLGLMRFTEILRNVDLTSRYNYSLNTAIYEVDVVLIQLMTLLIRPEDLFGVFTRSFFSYSQEIIDFCLNFTIPQTLQTHPYSKQIILALEDFLEFFIYMMNDELCVISLNLRDKLSRIRPGFPPERVIRKIFINILHEGKWANVATVKDIVHTFLCENPHTPIDAVLSSLVIKDEQTHQVKLKRGYESEVDPYMFYKLYLSHRGRLNHLVREELASKGVDIVSGMFYTDLPEYLNMIQYNIFQSQLPDFVCHLINNFCKEITRLLQPALKLVLFNLQVMSESLKSQHRSTEGLQRKVQANYLNNTFISSLNRILGQSDYKDCEPCIRKIQGLIQDLSSKLTVSDGSVDQNLVEQIEEIKEDLVEEKKRQAKQKMEKLKQEFAKKQNRFAEKNEGLLTQINLSPDNKRDDDNSDIRAGRTCQYCLDPIDELSSEEYGVPIYIEFTNNFYHIEKVPKFKPFKLWKLSQEKWWPMISSCNHYYHRKCFDLHMQNSRGPQNLSSQLFINDCEVQCALCKKLHNNFLVMNKKSEFEKYAQYSSEFNLKLQYLLTHLQERLGNKNANQFGILLEEIFRRSYEYFIESFYLHEKPQAFIEKFELYLNFFKIFKSDAQNEVIESTERSSFFEVVLRRKEKLSDFSPKQDFLLFPDSIVNKLSFTLLQEQATNTSMLDSTYQDDHLRIIKECTLFSIVDLASGELQDDNHIQLKDIPELYKNNEFRDKVTSKLSFLIQKIALGYYLNSCILSSTEESARSEFCLAVLNAEDSSEKLDLALQKAGISSSVEALIESSLLLLENLTESEQSLLASHLNPENGYSFFIFKLKMAPRYIQLPQTYTEYSTKHTLQKCARCCNYPRANDLIVCLICGVSMCVGSCSIKKSLGNASLHAAEFHMGLGLFFATDIHSLIEVKLPFNMLYFPGPSYVNELGESLIEVSRKPNLLKKIDFSKFVLESKTAENIKNIIVNHSVGQEIFERAPMNPTNIFNDLSM